MMWFMQNSDNNSNNLFLDAKLLFNSWLNIDSSNGDHNNNVYCY